MIGLIFEFAGDVVEVRVNGNQITFRTSSYSSFFVPIEALKLDRNGVEREFPDLKGNEEWREKAIGRFKSNIRTMANENKIAEYIIEDLKKFGYIPKFRQKQGHRVEAII